MTLAGTKPDKAWVDAVVATVGLGDRLRHRPSELSGGQQQRVAVARALASKPELIFADEPTGNLDSRAGAEILTFMRHAVDAFGQTIVMVTHDPVAASYADTVIFLADGRIVDSMARPSPQRILDRMKAFARLIVMLRTILTTLWSRKRRLAGTSIAVVLGVAFLAATLILGATTKAGFRDTFTAANDGTDVVVRNATRIGSEESRMRGLIDESTVADVAAVDGVAAAVARGPRNGPADRRRRRAGRRRWAPHHRRQLDRRSRARAG